MTKLKIYIGIFIIFSYLCPFESCGFHNVSTIGIHDDSLLLSSNQNDFRLDSVNAQNTNFFQEPFKKLIFPTENSISGIGLILTLETNFKAFLILISLILSFLSIKPFGGLKFGKRLLMILICNLLVLSFYFVLTQFVEQGDLQWGFWILFSLMAFRTLLETKFINKPPANTA